MRFLLVVLALAVVGNVARARELHGVLDFSGEGTLSLSASESCGVFQLQTASNGVAVVACGRSPGARRTFALRPTQPSGVDWAGKTLSLFVELGDVPSVEEALSIDFLDVDGEVFRYRPAEVRHLGKVTRLNYRIAADGTYYPSWGAHANGVFDGQVTLKTIRGTFRRGFDVGGLVLNRLGYYAEEDVSRNIDIYHIRPRAMPLQGHKPLKGFVEGHLFTNQFGKVERCDHVRGTSVEALDFDIETGNALNLIRRKGERAVMRFRNLSREKREWKGTVAFRDFYGRTFSQAVEVVANAGETVRVPVSEMKLRKGIWFVTADLVGDDGQEGETEARFAVIDLHTVTPTLPKPNFRMGINYHAHFYANVDDHFNLALDALVASGAKLVRSGGFRFAEVSKLRGVYDWTRSDRILAAYRERGLSVSAGLYETPGWARKPKPRELRHRTNPPKEGLFRDYCAAVGRRYGTAIDYYEIGNEWDLVKSNNISVAEAKRIFVEACEGIRSVCPEATITTCGWAHPDTVSVKGSPNPGMIESFITNMPYDVWAVHLHGPFEEYVREVKDKLLPLRKRTGDPRPWFSNETAYNTRFGQERDAARAVWQKVLFAWASGSVDYSWYNLRATRWDPNSEEGSYGLLTPDYHPRAAFAAYATLTTLVHGGEFDACLEDVGLRQIYRLRAPRNEGMVVVGWDSDRPLGEVVKVKARARKAVLIDLMGNRTPLGSVDGTWEWTISENPSAVFFDGASLAEIVR